MTNKQPSKLAVHIATGCWYKEKTLVKPQDEDLAEAFAIEIDKLITHVENMIEILSEIRASSPLDLEKAKIDRVIHQWDEFISERS